jgi:hypothetical protein
LSGVLCNYGGKRRKKEARERPATKLQRRFLTVANHFDPTSSHQRKEEEFCKNGERVKYTRSTDWQGIFFCGPQSQRVKVGMINNMLPREKEEKKNNNQKRLNNFTPIFFFFFFFKKKNIKIIKLAYKTRASDIFNPPGFVYWPTIPFS